MIDRIHSSIEEQEIKLLDHDHRRELNSEEVEALKAHTSFPKSMDDHWVCYTHNDRSYFIRSWTKMIAFFIDYEEDVKNDCWTGYVFRGPAFNPEFEGEKFQKFVTNMLNGILSRT